jgi:hypothetical protein
VKPRISWSTRCTIGRSASSRPWATAYELPFQLLVYNLYRFHRGPLRWLPVIPAVGLLLQGASYLLDRVDRAERWTWMYMFVARKPA